MRRAFVVFVLLAVACDTAAAQYLARAVALRVDPDSHAPIIAMLPRGARVAVSPGPRPGWSSLLVGEISGFASNRSLILAEGPVDAEAYAISQACDLGYPYSGSAPYFGGLTALRTSGPLSLLLGEHIARPC
ncbi:MAG TPA: hypothetical protein VED87_11420 [Methylocystis sp.]|nr:hypothetical protein [Methylocystis sp.]